MTEPIFEKYTAGVKRTNFSETVKAECKTNLLQEEIKQILSVYAWADVKECSSVKDSLKFTIKTAFYLCYIDNEGVVKKTETSCETVGTTAIAGLNEGERVRIEACVEKNEVDTSGLNLVLSAMLTVKVVRSERLEITALTGGRELFTNCKEVSVLKDFGTRECVYPMEEEFELNGEVAEVLSHRADAVITATQCGVGSIIVDGQVFLTVIALQKSQKCSIIKETRTLPFRMEIEHEDAMPTMNARAFVKEKSFKTEILVDGETGRSTVNASVSMIFTGTAFVLDSVSLVVDEFSDKRFTEHTSELVELCTPKDLKTVTDNLTCRAGVEEMPIGVSLLAIGNERLEVVEKTVLAKGVKITAELSCTGYFSNADGELFTKRLVVPIEKNFDNVFEEGCSVSELRLLLEKSSARIVSATEVEIDGELILSVYTEEHSSFTYINDLSVKGDRPQNPHAISVYIPSEGEELWSLAKRLNTCPEAVVATNPELTFPLTGKERIVVYRQK